MKVVLATFAALAIACAPAMAKEQRLKTSELSDLLRGGKTIQVTGAGETFTGTLVLTSDGKGTGNGKVGPKEITFSGTWSIKKNRFCHNWAGAGGNETCDSWILIEPKKVKVVSKKTEVGIISWD